MSLTDKPMQELLAEFASRKPAPGGGSAAALAGSLAAALVEMVARLTATEQAQLILREAEEIRAHLVRLVDEDCEAFNAFVKAGPGGRQDALKRAALAPLETAELGYRVLQLADEMARNGNKNAITDAGVAALLANAAVQGGHLNVKINLRSIKDPQFKADAEARLHNTTDSEDRCRATMSHIKERLQSS